MPRINEYITVGFCSGYGDGDFRVSMGVEHLSKKEMDELKLATLTALRCAEDHWRNAQSVEQACQAQPKDEPDE